MTILPPQQLRVLECIWEGFSNKEIGTKLEISTKTIEKHRQILNQKANTRNGVALIRWGILNNFIKLPATYDI